jgi:hypothetical protein
MVFPMGVGESLSACNDRFGSMLVIVENMVVI